jgi:hypothetical protein
MAGEEKRRSERVIPVVNDEEVVLIHVGQQQALGKMLDLSEGGTLVYLFRVDDDVSVDVGQTFDLTLYHRDNIFHVPARIARRSGSGRLLGIEFVSPDEEALRLIGEKLIRMEVEWLRLSRKL